MARNGSGVYTPPAASYPAVSGTLIESAKFNAVIDDIATALTESMSVNGQTAMTGDLPMGTHKITGLGSGVAATDACAYGQAGSAAIAETYAATNKATPVDADVLPLADSAASFGLKKLTWANLKATLASTFASLTGATFAGLVNLKTGANIASAATINLSTATGNLVHITGTTATSAVIMTSGQHMRCIADGAWPLTYHATTNRINGGVDYTCAAGDTVDYFYDGTTVFGNITKKDGTAVVSASSGVTSFNTRTGAVTLSSADVTAALTFTPAVNTHNHSGVYVAADNGHNAIGSYCYCYYASTATTTITPGTVVAGSLLKPSSWSWESGPVQVTPTSAALTGSWRIFGHFFYAGGASGTGGYALAQRIS